MALSLASDQSRFVTGQHMVIDGGTMTLGTGLYAGANPAGNAVMEELAEAWAMSTHFNTTVNCHHSLIDILLPQAADTATD